MITPATYQKLKDNGPFGNKVIAKLKGEGAVWLLIGMENDGDTLWGACDIGKGYIEYGPISLRVLTNLGRVAPIQQDVNFVPRGTLKDYLQQKTLLDF